MATEEKESKPRQPPVPPPKRRGEPFIALYDYAATAPDELNLAQGDKVIGLIDNGDGWWVGQLHGRKGMFPFNYVRPAGQVEARPAPPVTNAAGETEVQTDGGKTVAIKRKKLPKLRLAYGAWAYYMTLTSAVYLFFFGMSSIAWHLSPKAEEPELAGLGSSVVGFYCMGLAVAMVAFEWKFGMQVPLLQDTRVPVRGIVQLGLAVFTWFSAPTVMAAFPLTVTALVNIWAVHRGEWSNAIQRRKISRRIDISNEYLASMTLKEKAKWWFDRQREADNLGKIIILAIYFIANFWLGLDTWVFWANTIAELTNLGQPAPSSWAPVAKTCGMLLNVNCALLLLPILRGLMRWLNNRQIGRSRTLANFIPLRLNVEFHKLVAIVVGALAFFHVWAHFMNFAQAPKITLDLFPSTTNPPWFGVVRYAPWVTGALITIAMFFIFSAAPAIVRRAMYELFWWNHHLFVLFYVAQIFHGPRFLYWTALPIFLYIVERLLRVKRGKQVIYVKNVKWIEPVLCLEFCPKDKSAFKFVEGQYLYLCCPHISDNEWHPFTISSSVGDLVRDDIITCHIRVFPNGWTGKLKEYFELMNPRNRYPLVLKRRGDRGEVLHGKAFGPDNLPLLRVDGPHSAPTQHYKVYDTVMIIGAGIGLTPAASVARAILRYKWKKGYKPKYLHFYWIVRQCEVESFQWFVQLLAELEAELSRDRAAGNVSEDRYVELNIYVTRAKEDYPTPELLESARLNPVLKPHSQFSPRQLLEKMVHPTVPAKAQVVTMEAPEAAVNRLQDVWIWNGRPDWDQIFGSIKAMALYPNIGVCFCGAAVIGKDLAKNCAKHSSVEDDVLFHLHKENF